MHLESGHHAGPGLDGEGDAVGEGQPTGLAQVVEAAGDLAGHTFHAQVVVELQVEGHRPAPFLGQGKVLVAGGPHLHVVGAETLAGDLHPSLTIELSTHLRAVGSRQRGLHVVDPLAEARAEGLEVGDHGPGHEIGEGLDVLELAHVELGLDLVLHLVGEPEARMQQQGPSQGLAGAHAGVGTGGPAQAHDAPSRLHLGRQLGVGRTDGFGPVGQVYRLRTGEGAVHLVGQERAQRGQQL